MDGEILTIGEAAHLMKVAPEVIEELLNANELPGRIVGGEWRTTTRALLSFVDGAPLAGAASAMYCMGEEGEMKLCAPGQCCSPGQVCG